MVSLLSGLGALAHEVAWTRALVLLVGPTAYAFAFVVASVIAGLALGAPSLRVSPTACARPALALAVVQAGIAAWALVLVPLVGLPALAHRQRGASAGGPAGPAARLGRAGYPRSPARSFRPLWRELPAGRAPRGGGGVAARAACRPRARVEHGGSTRGAPPRRVRAPASALGLQWTLLGAAAIHGVAALVALAAEAPATHDRRTLRSGLALLVPIVALAFVPRWDLERLAGGAYRYGHREAEGDLEDSLRAGELLYYRDGTLATVSVKRLGNAKALAVDGKVDATNGADMATQRLLAHLPLCSTARRDGWRWWASAAGPPRPRPSSTPSRPST